MEHLQHFGLTRDPFSNEPDLRFYFESGCHYDAQRRVERGLRQHKGLTVLTGDGGMGKTLLARRILEALEEEVFESTLLMLLPGAADATSILQRFARQIGCDEPATDRAELLSQLYEHLSIVREDGRHAVLIIDDAQIMSADSLAELGGLLSLEYEDKRLLSMLLVGSPDLDKQVENDAGMKPRVDVRVRLQPFDLVNAEAYVKHRLASVDGPEALVASESIETLHKFGRGRPRLINTLADNALFETYLGGRQVMESMDVERAAGDLGIGPDPGTTFSPQHRSVPAPPALAPAAPSVVPESTPTAPAPVVEPVVAEEDPAESAPALSLDDSAGVLEFSEIPEAPAAQGSLVEDDDLSAPDLAGLVSAAAPLESVVKPAEAFSIDLEAESVPSAAPELELTAEVPASVPVATSSEAVSPTFDLDEGLEAALEEFEVPEDASGSPSLSLVPPQVEDPLADPETSFAFTHSGELELEMPASPEASDLIRPEREAVAASDIPDAIDTAVEESLLKDRALPPVAEMPPRREAPKDAAESSAETELSSVLPPAVDLMAEADAIESGTAGDSLDLGLEPVTTPAESGADFLEADELDVALDASFRDDGVDLNADLESDLDASMGADLDELEAEELTPLEVESGEEFADGIFVELLEE